MYKILIVEDEEKLSAFIVKGFQKHGFSATVAADGEQALEISQMDTYDAILLDLGLPGKDGWAVLKELRDRGDFPPIIVMTALSDLHQAVLAARANDYLQKPFRFSELLAMTQQHIAMTQSAKSSET